MVYRSNPVRSNETTDIWKETDGNLSILEQSKILSSVPNYHQWDWPNEKQHCLKFEQRLPSCNQRFPGSPRNRIIQAIYYRKDPALIVYQCLKNVAGEPTPVEYDVRRKRKFHQVLYRGFFVICTTKIILLIKVYRSRSIPVKIMLKYLLKTVV